MPLTGDYLRRATAEFVGTFALVFVAVGALIYSDVNGAALAYGFVVAVMVSAIGHVSGGHLNPAVTFGFVLTRRISPQLAVAYLVSQLTGAIAAAALLKWLLPKQLEDGIGLGAPTLISSSGVTITAGQGVVIEAVLTCIAVWVFFATAVDPRGTFKQIAGLAYGLTVAAGVLFAARLTGAAMNPARAFGPELLGDHWKDAWVWYLGPFAGAAVGAVLYELLYLRPARPVVVGTPESEVDEPRPGDTALS